MVQGPGLRVQGCMSSKSWGFRVSRFESRVLGGVL